MQFQTPSAYSEANAEILVKNEQNAFYYVRNNVNGPYAGTQTVLLDVMRTPTYEVLSTNHTFHSENPIPASYPSIVRGCHPWGRPCTDGWTSSHLNELAEVTSQWTISNTSAAGIWNAAYDLWINPTNNTSGAPTGTELMIWMYSRGDIRPGGELVGTIILREKINDVWQPVNYDVYHAAPWSNWQHYVAYRRQEPTTGTVDINLTDALVDCQQRGYCNSDDYLVAIEAGFEIWEGGVGLKTNNFSTNVLLDQRNLLSVSKNPDSNAGTITSSPYGVNCGSDCNERYANNTQVTLTALAENGWRFTGWSGGGCSGTGTCIVTMDAAKSVDATFSAAPQTYALSVSVNGNGGKVSGTGIACPGDCGESYASGTPVMLGAETTGTTTFTNWSGDCSGNLTTCTVTMDAIKNVTANFQAAAPTYSLTVNNFGSGTVSSTGVAGINCGTDCTETYTNNQSVTLTAVPAAGGMLLKWQGACLGNRTNTCTLNMNANQTATVFFTR
ncbi:InlB B-repeat-containing protein [Thiospirillum jenense]|uniref:Bacterial repeat domain-containing protein n=1 Tax=Thiospirillum jenense TaxID=1653858 RepID=A0A839HC81_9GAMM|nr:hypothetical protein [Thiospirillum jenense]MBB1124807.1 hypothetical protein [Thiospirillum jenense]